MRARLNKAWIWFLFQVDEWMCARLDEAYRREKRAAHFRMVREMSRLRIKAATQRIKKPGPFEKADRLWMEWLGWVSDWAMQKHQRADARFQARWLKRELKRQDVWRN